MRPISVSPLIPLLSALAIISGSRDGFADQILVAKDPATAAPTIVRKSGGVCSKAAVPTDPNIPTGQFFEARGTPGDDVIVVFDQGTPRTWCGHAVQPLDPLGENQYLAVLGDYGKDIIWGGNAPKQRGYRICGGNHCAGWSADEDDAENFIYAGPGNSFTGGSRKDYVVMLHFNSGGGGWGDDLFCTAVPNVASGSPAGAFILDGDEGSDTRSGPPGRNESSVETGSVSAYQNQCSTAYSTLYNTVLQLWAAG